MTAIDPQPSKLGERGEHVKLWQEFLEVAGYSPGPIDGIHGRMTEAATLLWRSEQETPRAIELPFIAFRLARHFRKGRQASILWVVIHTAETLEKGNSAEALAMYAATMADNRVASWHYATDNDSVTQSVLEDDTAFAAPGANDRGIQIELAGFAGQTRIQWNDAFSQAQLRLTAKLVASICRRHRIPVVKLSPDDMQRGLAGICGHHDATLAFKKSTHTDPGKNFPWDDFITQVLSHV